MTTFYCLKHKTKNLYGLCGTDENELYAFGGFAEDDIWKVKNPRIAVAALHKSTTCNYDYETPIHHFSFTPEDFKIVKRTYTFTEEDL